MAWEHYLRQEAPELPAPRIDNLGVAAFVLDAGGRVWFPGCGVDPNGPLFAALGCDVVATDHSPFAIEWQERVSALPPTAIAGEWDGLLARYGLTPRRGRFRAAVEDFLTTHPEGPFDVVVNRRALSPLSPVDQRRAARNFERCTRPGGALIVDTINVQGDARDRLEDSLLEAGYFIPGNEVDRWYRAQLAGTGILYMMILGRPMVPDHGQYPKAHRDRRRKEDQAILDAFGAEYVARRERVRADVERRLEDGVTKVAHVIYSTG